MQTLDSQAVTSLVRAATAAPSLHNAQPWRFRFLSDSATFQVRAALDRCLPHEDPHGRALHLGCAAAVFNLRVAAAHASWLPVTTLLPDPYDPRLLATVRLDRPRAGGDLAGLATLYPAIRLRHTCRHRFRPDPVPGAIRAELRDAAGQEGAHLHFTTPGEARAILELTRDAEGHGLALADAPQLALLGTDEDRPLDWLHAGQALERVLLLATAHGLAAVLTSHTPEWAEAHAPERPQVILRLGYAPPSPATPRRPVPQVLDLE